MGIFPRWFSIWLGAVGSPLFLLFAPLSLTAQGLLSGSQQPLRQLAPEVNGPFALSDAGYALAIALSVAQLEPVENIDEWTSYELSRDIRLRNTWPRWGGRQLGNGGVTLALASAPLLYGVAIGDPDARRLGLQSLESLFAAAFVTRLIKTGVGRGRPHTSPEPDRFEPFSGDAAFHSFPSGHTARVFAVAATFARELGDAAPWVPFVVYPLAAWTAATRVMDRAHWLTDITGGALLGILTSRLVGRLNHQAAQARRIKLEVAPTPDGEVELAFILSVP